ncbi:DUF4145 domain-containing protein [bacterium]|nr:DUF4145 domain-containing protein [bacterium]
MKTENNEALVEKLSWCNNCGHKTKHIIQHTGSWSESFLSNESDPRSWYKFDYVWKVLQCKGCDAYKVEELEFLDNQEFGVTQYPASIARQLPDWIGGLPQDLGDLMREVYSAISHHSNRLAAMGLRAMADFVIRDRVGEQSSFRKGLEAIEGAGLIGRKQSEYFASVVEAGHAANHRGWNPKKSEVNHMAEITENVLHTTYILGKHSESLQATTPKRKKMTRK